MERVDVEAVLARADLRQVVEHYLGAPMKSNERGAWWRCPFHQERTASFLVGGQAKYAQRYHCYGCGAHGDAVEFVRLQERWAGTGKEFIQAVRRVAEICAVRADAPVVAIPVPPEVYGPPGVVWQAAARRVCEEAQAALWSSWGRGCRRYLLEERGLTEETLREWGLGWQVGTVSRPADEWGMPERERMVWIPQGLVIPGRVGETLWYVKIRPSKAVQFPGKYYQVPSPAAQERTALLGVDRWVEGRPVVLCEGELDLFTVWQEGHRWVNGATLGGARKGLQGKHLHLGRWLGYLAAADAVWVAYDTDAAGQEAIEALRAACGRWEGLNLPFGKDVNEFHTSGGDVGAWLRAAVGKEDAGGTEVLWEP